MSIDFVNSTVNVVSGAIYIRDKQLHPGGACTANGWIAQLSVQATDFSILAISVATLLVVTQRARLVHLSTRASIAICLSVWIMPLITSTTAAAMRVIQPVSGNWCWITSQRTDLRYGLTHGWRFAIIGTTIAIYSYIWWYLGKHFKSMRRFDITVETNRLRESIRIDRKRSRQYIDLDEESEREHGVSLQPLKQIAQVDSKSRAGDVEAQDYSSETNTMSPSDKSPPYIGRSDTYMSSGSNLSTEFTTDRMDSGTSGTNSSRNPAQDFIRSQSDRRYREIKRMLLLNGYPLLYVILWIPGIVNRIMEGLGSQNTRVQNILQCSTQFVGFANAITYGLSQQWRAER